MRLLVRMALDIRFFPSRREPFEQFECVAARLRRPVHGAGKTAYLKVDVELPLQYVEFANPRLWNSDGTYPVEARLIDNRHSLRAFLDGDEHELDVREVAYGHR